MIFQKFTLDFSLLSNYTTGKELEYKRSQCSYEMIKDYHIFIDKCPKIKFKKILECKFFSVHI